MRGRENERVRVIERVGEIEGVQQRERKREREIDCTNRLKRILTDFQRYEENWPAVTAGTG